MKIVGLQFEIAWEDRRSCYARIESALGKAGRFSPETLVVLPELALAGFTMNAEGVSEPRGGESENFLAEMAQKFEMHILGGVAVDLGDGKAANEAVCFTPNGQEVARYRKRRPFSKVDEGNYYSAGNETVVFSIGDWKIAPLICYDLRFPELFREAVLAGAEVFVVIANWPSVRVDHWTTLLRARAIENLAYVVGVNRSGSDPYHPYPGASIIVNPKGEVLAQAGTEAALVSAELDRTALLEWRSDFPALDDLKRFL